MTLKFPDCIVFEGDYVLVVHKPAGLMVEPDRNGNPNLLNEVKKYLKSSTQNLNEVYAQHLHRLDRPVSGLVLFTKQKEVLKNLSEQFAFRKVKKYYYAVTSNEPAIKSGTLEHWHRKEKKKAVIYEHEIEYAERASLTYEVSTLATNRFLWNIELHTGKYHQIRAQLAYVGCPIIGDELYGSELSCMPGAIALQAWKLIFHHPITNKLITCEKRDELMMNF